LHTYLVARYSSDGARLELVGHFDSLDAAIHAATAVSASESAQPTRRITISERMP